MKRARQRSWGDVKTRIGHCRAASDPVRCLQDLFSETNDGMVAFALGNEYDARGKPAEARRYYEMAETLFPLEEWKEKARVARSGVNGGRRTGVLLQAGGTLFIVQCTRNKIWTDPSENREFVPAKQAYIGGGDEPYAEFVDSLKKQVPKDARWLYLSAKCGFIEPDHPISNYNVTFSDPATGPISYETLANQVTSQWRWKDQVRLTMFARVVVCGGPVYLNRVKCAFSSTQASVIGWEEYRSESEQLAPRIRELRNRLASLLAIPLVDMRNLQRGQLPNSPGIYAVYRRDLLDPLYVGRSENLARRILDNHIRGNVESSVLRKKIGRQLGTQDEDRITEWITGQCLIRFMPMEEPALSVLEHFAISLLKPALND